ELLGRGQVSAERLLDDDAPPALALLEAVLVELGGDGPEYRGRDGIVEQHVVAGLVLDIELPDLLGQLGVAVGGTGVDVVKPTADPFPDLGIEVLAGVVLLDAVFLVAEAGAE